MYQTTFIFQCPECGHKQFSEPPMERPIACDYCGHLAHPWDWTSEAKEPGTHNPYREPGTEKETDKGKKGIML